jgi:hypothetical protein
MGWALVALSVAVALGAANLAAWMRGQRRRALILAHLLAGVGGVALYYFALPEAAEFPVRFAGNFALALFVVAILAGLAAPRLGNGALTLHLSCGVVAFFVALALRWQL